MFMAQGKNLREYAALEAIMMLIAEGQRFNDEYLGLGHYSLTILRPVPLQDLPENLEESSEETPTKNSHHLPRKHPKMV
jgi:hypothetical protein